MSTYLVRPSADEPLVQIVADYAEHENGTLTLWDEGKPGFGRILIAAYNGFSSFCLVRDDRESV